MSKRINSRRKKSRATRNVKLALVLNRSHNYCFIVYMDERWRSFRGWSNARVFTANNGWGIQSIDQPEIRWGEKTIFLRGQYQYEDGMMMSISTDEEIEKLIHALKDWAKNWVGWRTEERIPQDPFRKEEVPIGTGDELVIIK